MLASSQRSLGCRSIPTALTTRVRAIRDALVELVFLLLNGLENSHSCKAYFVAFMYA